MKMKDLARHPAVRALGTLIYMVAVPLWVLSSPVRRYFRWLDHIMTWRIRGDITRRQFAKMLGRWYLVGALVQYPLVGLYYWWTGQITSEHLATFNLHKLWQLVDEETILFLGFLPLFMLVAAVQGWFYRKGLLSDFLLRKIRAVPKPKRKT